jgi:methyl-accepting chemotaxis protein WspA
MRNLRIWQKLMVMGAVFMVPFAVATYTMLPWINSIGPEFARQEVRGLEYAGPLQKFLQDMQRHRGMAAAVLAGDASFKDGLASKRSDVRNAIKNVDEIDRRLAGALRLGGKWAALSAAADNLLEKSGTLSPDESFEQHTKVIGDTLALIADVSDTSNLTLDPDLDSYYLMSIVVFQGPELTEVLAQARGVGNAIAAARQGTPEQFERLRELSILAAFLARKLDDSLGKAVIFNATLKPTTEPYTSTGSRTVRDAASQAATIAASRKGAPSAAAYNATMSATVDAVFDVGERASQSLNGLLHARIAKFRREMLSMFAWVTLGMLVVALVGFLIMRDMSVTLGRVVATANRVATGDLTAGAANESRKDEIGLLSRGVHDMIVALASLVGQVQRSGLQVNASVNEIAASAREQQATAAEVAATTFEIGATSKEITATSRELVRTMVEVSTVAEHTATLAGDGQAGLTRMDGTMQHIIEAAGSINVKLAVLSEKAGNITHVVTTITQVADKTNLLSLNAAIEAEKAGEYGRGFAVVATEIRHLADQTAVATHDIKQMVREIQSAVSAGMTSMDAFSQEVRRGMQEIQQVGGQLSEIIQQVQALAPRCEAVSEGMQAQSTGAEQITEALAHLSEAAQQTVESLRQASQAIDGLNQAAAGMRTGVSRFTVAA